MKKVVLARIDERLLHGQVVVNWLPVYDIKEIIIIDNEIAEDDFLKEITLAAAPKSARIHVFAENQIDELRDLQTEGNAIIITKNIFVIPSLLSNGISFNQLNLGGLSMIKDRKRYLDFLCLSNSEIDELKEIEDKYDVEVFAQMIPNSLKFDLNKL